MKLFIFALLSFAVFTHAAASEPPTTKPPKLYIHAGAIKRTYTCAPGVEAGGIPDGVVHASLHHGDNRYLLIAYSIPSRPGSPNKRCGGGIESYLVWLHIRGLTIIASQSAQYESCWRDINGGPPAWLGKSCVVEYERFLFDDNTNKSSLLRSKASFDSKAPDKGLQITDQPPEILE